MSLKGRITSSVELFSHQGQQPEVMAIYAFNTTYVLPWFAGWWHNEEEERGGISRLKIEYKANRGLDGPSLCLRLLSWEEGYGKDSVTQLADIVEMCMLTIIWRVKHYFN